MSHFTSEENGMIFVSKVKNQNKENWDMKAKIIVLALVSMLVSVTAAQAQGQKVHTRPITRADIPDQSDKEAKLTLDKASERYRTKPMKIDFQIVMEDTKTGKKETTNGNLVVKGDKFVLSLPDAQTYFNGKEEWIYVAKNNEVTVTYPTQKELQELNPSYILNSYLGNTTVQWSRDNKKSDSFYTIDIYPAYKDKKDYYKVVVKVNRQTYDVKSIQVMNRNGVHAHFTVVKTESKKFDDTHFTFYPKSYPGVTINDMR